MLILSRKLGENIVIGEDVVVTILGIKGKQIRLGIEAPQSISVHREEIYLKIKEERKAALSSSKIPVRKEKQEEKSS